LQQKKTKEFDKYIEAHVIMECVFVQHNLREHFVNFVNWYFINQSRIWIHHLGNPCYEPICKNNGICSVISNPTNVSFTCACPHSYTGQYCEISLITRKVDQCTGQCQNGGSCANGICMCTSEYIGPECQYGKKN